MEGEGRQSILHQDMTATLVSTTLVLISCYSFVPGLKCPAGPLQILIANDSNWGHGSCGTGSANS